MADVAMHVGRRDHYRLAAELVSRRPERAVLIQRSSTVLLGAEVGWDREVEFHDEIWRSVADGTRWFHIASLVGIERHLHRRSSSFAFEGACSPHVIDRAGFVCIPCGTGTPQAVHVLPEEGDRRVGVDFKIDRQARLLAVDFGGWCEALIVSDVGDQQVTIRLGAGAADELFRMGRSFYDRCPSLTGVMLGRCLAANVEMEITT